MRQKPLGHAIPEEYHSIQKSTEPKNVSLDSLDREFAADVHSTDDSGRNVDIAVDPAGNRLLAIPELCVASTSTFLRASH
jgi:hypothetical protein